LPNVSLPNLDLVSLKTCCIEHAMSLLLSAPKLTAITISISISLTNGCTNMKCVDTDPGRPQQFRDQLAQGAWPALTKLRYSLDQMPCVGLLSALYSSLRMPLLRTLVCVVEDSTASDEILALLRHQRQLETCEIRMPVRLSKIEELPRDAGEVTRESKANKRVDGKAVSGTRISLPALRVLRLDIADDVLIRSVVLPNLTDLSLGRGKVTISKFSDVFAMAPSLKYLAIDDICVDNWDPPLWTTLQSLSFTGNRGCSMECRQLIRTSPDLVTLRLSKSLGFFDDLVRARVRLPCLRKLHVWEHPHFLKHAATLVELKGMFSRLGEMIDKKIAALPYPSSLINTNIIACWHTLAVN
jgi:hypothetical protein